MINTKRIKYRMKAMGVSQKEMAEALGIKHPTVSQKLNNVRPMTMDEAEVIASLLKIEDSDWNKYFFSGSKISAEKVKDMEKADALDGIERLMILSNSPMAQQAETVAIAALAHGCSVAYAKSLLSLADRILDIRGKELKQNVRDAAEHPEIA